VGSTTYYITNETVTSGTPQFRLANNTNPNSRPTGNYVVFSNVAPANGQITLTNTSVGGGNDTAAINGFQLIPQIKGTQALVLPSTLGHDPSTGLKPPGNTLSGNLRRWDATNNQWVNVASTADANFNPNLPTIVITHGWHDCISNIPESGVTNNWSM